MVMSFLSAPDHDEPTPNDPSAQDTPASPPEEPQSMSLLGGIAGSAETPGSPGDPLGLTPPAKPKRLSPTTLAVLTVVLVSAAALLAMKMTAGPEAADASTQQFVAEIDTAIQKLRNPDQLAPNDPLRPDKLQALFSKPEEVIAHFDRDRTDKHVPLHEVHKNPFRFGTPQREEVDPDAARRAAEAEAMRLQAERIKQLRDKADRLVLQSVMNGPSPIAVINGEFLRVGATIEDFTVKAIDRLEVTLTAEDQTFKLSVKR